jgi:hypothetical protein
VSTDVLPQATCLGRRPSGGAAAGRCRRLVAAQQHHGENIWRHPDHVPFAALEGTRSGRSNVKSKSRGLVPVGFPLRATLGAYGAGSKVARSLEGFRVRSGCIWRPSPVGITSH